MHKLALSKLKLQKNHKLKIRSSAVTKVTKKKLFKRENDNFKIMGFNSDLLERLIIDFVNAYSNVPDFQLNPRFKPRLWFWPMKTYYLKKRAAHHFLLAASLTETKIAGNSRNVRVILDHFYWALHNNSNNNSLYTKLDPLDFEKELKKCESKFRLFGKFGKESDKIPRIIVAVNKFVQNEAKGDLIEYSRNIASHRGTPEDMVEKLGMIGARLGGRHKGKAWLYMRWMVRDKPDLRLFDSFSPRDLLIPLTAASLRVALALGIVDKNIADVMYSDEFWKDHKLIRNIQVKLTEYARALFPDDPAKADHPFFVLGRWLKGFDLNREVLIKLLVLLDRNYKELEKPPIEYLVQVKREAREIGAVGSEERFVAEELEKRKISFDYEPIEFKLSTTPGEPPTYKPDFILDVNIDGKKIILEPHGNWKREDRVTNFVRKLSFFKKRYGENFILILIVPNLIFHDIRQRFPPDMGFYDILWSRNDFIKEFDHLLSSSKHVK